MGVSHKTMAEAFGLHTEGDGLAPAPGGRGSLACRVTPSAYPPLLQNMHDNNNTVWRWGGQCSEMGVVSKMMDRSRHDPFAEHGSRTAACAEHPLPYSRVELPGSELALLSWASAVHRTLQSAWRWTFIMYLRTEYEVGST